MIIPRRHHIDVVREALERSPIVAILGPRQIGKTTLAREIEALQGGSAAHFDLEDMQDGQVIDNKLRIVNPFDVKK